jgi:hypothetical protein
MVTIVQSTAVREKEPIVLGSASGLNGLWLVLAALVAILFVAGLAAVAVASGMICVLFPEMGALAQDVFTRPNGTWSNAPIYLVLTPSVAAILGVLVAEHFSYGYFSVFLAVGAAVAVLKIMRSPIVPSISAALLPVVFEERSWWYPAAVFFGAAGLVLLSAVWKRVPSVSGGTSYKRAADPLGISRRQTKSGSFGLVALGIFLALSVTLVKLTGLRLLLFPPLAVIAYEMFSKPRTCLWADRPFSMPLACFLTASGGLFAYKLWGVSVMAAAASMVWGFAVLYLLRIHLPPAMAVALIPLIAKHPTIIFPVAVASGTILLTVCYLGYRQMIGLRLPVRPSP